jgi:hypothetical protein
MDEQKYIQPHNTVYISFGSSCAVAYHLGLLGKRQMSFPFDWINSSIHSIIDIIYNQFQSFTDATKIKNIFSHPILDENWQESKAETTKCINIYKCIFVHDFNKDMTNIEEVKQKYIRRIERFTTIMRDEKIHKKIYCVGTSKDMQKLSLLRQTMDNANYVNYVIKFKLYSEMGNNSCWKMTCFNWKTWFDE